MARKKQPKLHQIQMSDGTTVMTYDDDLAAIAAEKAAEHDPVQTTGTDGQETGTGYESMDLAMDAEYDAMNAGVLGEGEPYDGIDDGPYAGEDDVKEEATVQTTGTDDEQTPADAPLTDEEREMVIGAMENMLNHIDPDRKIEKSVQTTGTDHIGSGSDHFSQPSENLVNLGEAWKDLNAERAGGTGPEQDEMPVTGLAITTSATTITLPENLNLKDTVLRDYTVRIANTINSTVLYVEQKNREIARMLGDISMNKRYVADGFKSVAEYAAEFFGYKKSAAYMLASAGEVYLDPTASEELKAFSPYKLAEFSKVDKDRLDAAAKSGAIKPSDTVKDLRDKARTMQAVIGDGEVERLYSVSLRTSLSPVWNMEEKNAPIFEAAKAALGVDDLLMVNSFAVVSKVPPNTVELLLEQVKGLILWKSPKKVIVTALPKIKTKYGKGKNAVSRETLRYLLGDGDIYMVIHLDEWKAPVKEPEPEKLEVQPEPEKKRRYTVEELQKMLEEAQREIDGEKQPEAIELPDAGDDPEEQPEEQPEE